MCSRTEWQYLVSRFEDAVEEGQLRDFVSDAAARIEALIEEMTAWTCPPEKTEWVREQRRPEWIV